ncbi:MAG: hypothetical protein IPK07_35305 [Deltaproteobacteria bacterium]|nr:hypothetical protein [Deltaproteobacteria bacterium]
MTTLLVALVLAVHAVWLPGALFTRLVMPEAERFTAQVVGVALGFYVMPVVYFGAAMVFRTVVSIPLVLGVATAIDAALAAALVVRARRGSARRDAAPR